MMSSWPALTLARFTVREALRTRYWQLLGAVVLLGCALGAFAGGIAITESAANQSVLMASYLRLASVFLVALFVTSSMHREQADRVTELLLALPLSRAAYLLGKLAGYALVACVTALAIALTLLPFASPTLVLVWSMALLLELLIIVTVSVFCLCTLRQPTQALAAIAAFYVLARSLAAFRLMCSSVVFYESSPAFTALARALDLLALLLPELHRYAPAAWLAGTPIPDGTMSALLLQSVCFCTVTIGASLVDFYRRSW